jgi:hypothetical protein
VRVTTFDESGVTDPTQQATVVRLMAAALHGLDQPFNLAPSKVLAVAVGTAPPP